LAICQNLSSTCSFFCSMEKYDYSH
jgi:hypothetical protein